ncbi:MAG: hypothetical protein R3E87_12100 [Burkholderiaceae bacterium]
MIDATPPRPETVSDLRRLLTALLPTLAVAPAALAQDATKVQPHAYKTVFENEHLRVLEYVSRPGMGICGEGMHSHPAHLTITLTEANARVTREDGKIVTVRNEVGDVFWSEAGTHEVENIGGRNVRALIVELKQA